MSIDLSRVTGISDSRGSITEIKDSLGRVIWSGAKDPVITITGDSSYISYTVTKYAATVTVNGTEYHSDAKIAVPAGTTITLALEGNDNQYFYYPAVIYLNGEQMFVGDSEGATPSHRMYYVDYVVQGNVSIRLEVNEYKQFGTSYYGTIYITET